MSTKDVLALALEALEEHDGNYAQSNASAARVEAAITAIKQAQEPVDFIVSAVLLKETERGFNTQNKLYAINASNSDEAIGKVVPFLSTDFPEHRLHTMCFYPLPAPKQAEALDAHKQDTNAVVSQIQPELINKQAEPLTEQKAAELYAQVFGVELTDTAQRGAILRLCRLAAGLPAPKQAEPAVQESLTVQDLDTCRQWFDSVQDTNGGYLTPNDYVLAAKLYRTLGMRVPSSITSMLAAAPTPPETL